MIELLTLGFLSLVIGGAVGYAIAEARHAANDFEVVVERASSKRATDREYAFSASTIGRMLSDVPEVGLLDMMTTGRVMVYARPLRF